MSDLRLLARGPMSPPEGINVRVRPPDVLTAVGAAGSTPPSVAVNYRPSSRAMCIQLPEPLQRSGRHLAAARHEARHHDSEDEDDESDGEEEQEPLRISFHEDEIRSHTSLSRPASRKSLHDATAVTLPSSADCILPPAGQFERPGTATANLDDIDIEDPYPSFAQVRTSASGLLRCPESDGLEGDESDHPAPCPPPMQERESLSQCRLLPSPYPYWADDEDLQSPQQKDPFVGYVSLIISYKACSTNLIFSHSFVYSLGC